MHSRRYSAFISYRHADNTQEGRRWAEWLHRALERYVVPPDLIGTPNLRGEPIRDSLYPIFRDEDELPANADLATGIRAALEVSDHLIVLCSPRSAVSPWVRKEVREFKELGRSDRILAIIIAGEPNADDPAKAREGILRDEECFCEELRFGAMGDDGILDWQLRAEPTAADLRSNGRAEGFVSAEACREHYTSKSGLSPEQIAAFTDEYCKRLERGKLRIIAGLLGVSPGQLKERDTAYRIALAEAEADKQREIADRERQLAEQAQHSAEEAHHAKRATERTAYRLAIAGAVALVLAMLAGWFWWRAKATSESVVRLVGALQPLATHGAPEKMDAKEINKTLLAWLEKNEPEDADAELLEMYANLLVFRIDLEAGNTSSATLIKKADEVSQKALSAHRYKETLNIRAAILQRMGLIQFKQAMDLSPPDPSGGRSEFRRAEPGKHDIPKAAEEFERAKSIWADAFKLLQEATSLSRRDPLFLEAQSAAQNWMGSADFECAKLDPKKGEKSRELAAEAKLYYEAARRDLQDAIDAIATAKKSGEEPDQTAFLPRMEDARHKLDDVIRQVVEHLRSASQ